MTTPCENASPINIYRHKNGSYFLYEHNTKTYRVNRSTVISKSWNRINSDVCIFDGEISRIDDAAKEIKLVGYEESDGTMLSESQYVEKRNSLCNDFDEGTPYFISSEQRSKYHEWYDGVSRKYETVDTSKELEYVIIDIIHDVNEFYIPLWHLDLNKVNFFKLDCIGLAKAHVHQLAAHHGLIIDGDKSDTKGRGYCGYPTHTGLRYLTIEGKYYGNDSMDYKPYIGEFSDCQKRERDIKTQIDAIFAKWYASKHPIDGATIGDVLGYVSNIRSSFGKIQCKVKSRSDQRVVSNRLRELEEFLIKAGTPDELD